MLELKAEIREITGKKVKQLRKTGLIPAILYGHGVNPISLTVESKAFSHVLNEAGETSILQLIVSGQNQSGSKKHNVLIHDLARDPLSDAITHVDFFEVRMDEKIKAKVMLVFTGESNAIKSEGGVLVKALQEVELEALPQDLPKEIEVDISELNTFEDRIFVGDLKVGSNVKILADSKEMVATIVPPRSDRELEELKQKPAMEVDEVKMVGEEEKEKEEVVVSVPADKEQAGEKE